MLFFTQHRDPSNEHMLCHMHTGAAQQSVYTHILDLHLIQCGLSLQLLALLQDLVGDVLWLMDSATQPSGATERPVLDFCKHDHNEQNSSSSS